MVEPENTQSAAGLVAIPQIKVVQDIPILFVDGVMSQSYIHGISKFYLYRSDTSPNVSEPIKNVPVVQIVMPARALASMLHFLEHRLRIMIEDGAITQAEVDQIRKTVYPDPIRADAG